MSASGKHFAVVYSNFGASTLQQLALRRHSLLHDHSNTS